ncbi:MAG: hypothetical protein M5U08_15465 [Burkholderiales bacterium]|nr:hypothetical protein [Burkholderiales bacterium]
MILPDVNVLIYAFRADSAQHEQYRDWLESTINAPEAYDVARQALRAVVRVTTRWTEAFSGNASAGSAAAPVSCSSSVSAASPGPSTSCARTPARIAPCARQCRSLACDATLSRDVIDLAFMIERWRRAYALAGAALARSAYGDIVDHARGDAAQHLLDPESHRKRCIAALRVVNVETLVAGPRGLARRGVLVVSKPSRSRARGARQGSARRRASRPEQRAGRGRSLAVRSNRKPVIAQLA